MKEKLEQLKMKNKTRNIIVIAVAIITCIIAYIIFRGTYLETLEIGENYIGVFWKNLKYMLITLFTNFTVIYFAVYLTNKKIKKNLQVFFKQENKQMPKLLNKSIAFISAILVTIFTSNMLMEKAMLCFNNARFEIADPLFGIDIGYFVFIAPFIEILLWYFIILVGVLLIYTAIYYIVTFNMFFDGIERKMMRDSKVVKHIIYFVIIFSVLASVLILVTTQNIETDRFLSVGGEQVSYYLYGAGFTDAVIKLWGYRILSIVLLVSVFKAISYFMKQDKRKFIISLCVVPIYLVLLFFVLILFKAIFVNSNELDKQKEYIQNNINYTKNAYGINIEEINLKEDNIEEISANDLKKYSDTINNIAIVNKDIALKDVQKTQTTKGYYSYISTQMEEYEIDGEDKLVYISPREISSSNTTYNTKTYEYTHGYGAIVTSATETKENGSLNYIQKGFDEENEAIKISEPRIYFGMQTNNVAVTNVENKKEFDYLNTDTNTNMENSYNGDAGLKLNFLDRLILAIKEGDFKLAFSSNVTKESKILTNRNIVERAKTLMPYLIYDDNPYLVVSGEGRLIWVLDAYTVSNNYPYSQKTTVRENSTHKFELNYIRNSVKVLIDAYSGKVYFYITDRTDPIAMSYRNIYPDLFMNLEEQIPEDISKHFVYPEYLYKIQANVLTRYHNISPDVLYRNEDIWQIANYNSSKVLTRTGTEIKPYYTMVKTVEKENERLGLVLPYTPFGRQNLISYIVGSYENGKAELKLYKYEENANVLGTMQLDTQLEQDKTIVDELENLNVNGIKITKNIIVVPLDNDLLYVEPIYINYINEADSLPTLRKVIVASKNKVAIGNNLSEALNNLVSENSVNIEVENTDTINDLINTIIKANNNLKESNQSNNWEMMGKDVNKLQELINKLEQLVDENEQKNIVNDTISENTVV